MRRHVFGLEKFVSPSGRSLFLLPLTGFVDEGPLTGHGSLLHFRPTPYGPRVSFWLCLLAACSGTQDDSRGQGLRDWLCAGSPKGAAGLGLEMAVCGQPVGRRRPRA